MKQEWLYHEKLSMLTRGISRKVAEWTWDVVGSGSWAIARLIVQLFLFAEGIFWRAKIWFRLIETGRSFSFYCVEALAFADFCGLWSFLDDLFFRVIGTWAREIGFLFVFSTHSQRYFGSCVRVLSRKIGSWSRSLRAGVEGQSLSFAQRVRLSFAWNFFILRVILNNEGTT